MRTPSKVGLNGSLRSKIASPSSSRVPLPRTPSPEMPAFTVGSPINDPKTLSVRSIQPRLKKPSMPVIQKTTIPARPPSKGSYTSQVSSTGEDTHSTTSSISTLPTATSGDTSPQFKKSSAALREQIARAKAAKRTAAQQASAQLSGLEGGTEAPVIPTDSTFDFGLVDDPFNLHRDASSTTKVLQSRVATARTSGRLNIAAMGLKEIPTEVLNMYSLESIGRNDGSWAESIDLTRFVAADNELEMIEETLFPDFNPEDVDVDDDENAPCGMFGGLETLDLHGNMLISLPIGLRRLPLLTSLNLVCADFFPNLIPQVANTVTVFQPPCQ